VPGRLAGHSSKIGERRAYFFFFFFKEIFVTRVAAPVDLAAVDLAASLGVTFLFATIIHLPVEFRAPQGTYPKTYVHPPPVTAHRGVPAVTERGVTSVTERM
jgi:hypothetical protein